MQGIIFTLFADMVVERFGMRVWNAMLAEAAPGSDGIYTAGHSYEDAEMLALVEVLCEREQLRSTQVLQTFGRFLFPHLIAALPADNAALATFEKLLQSVGTVIHREIRRLNPGAQPPAVSCERSAVDTLLFHYQSSRALCELCDGILHAAGAHYGLSIAVQQLKCMHRGADECLFEIRGVPMP